MKGPDTISYDTAKKLLGVSNSRFYALVRAGEFFRFFRFPTCLLRSDVVAYRLRRDAWLRQHGRKVPGPPQRPRAARRRTGRTARKTTKTN